MSGQEDGAGKLQQENLFGMYIPLPNIRELSSCLHFPDNSQSSCSDSVVVIIPSALEKASGLGGISYPLGKNNKLPFNG
jgi:hypothetical protein